MKYKSRLLSIFIVILALIIAAFLYMNRSENSEQPNITQTKALAEVQVIPEVVEYFDLLEGEGKTPQTNVEDWEDTWAVQVFETVTEDDGTSHTATFGWYEVDKKTGKIKKN